MIREIGLQFKWYRELRCSCEREEVNKCYDNQQSYEETVATCTIKNANSVHLQCCFTIYLPAFNRRGLIL